MYVQDGDDQEVQLPPGRVPKLKGRILVHNHPDCQGKSCLLSEADIELADGWGLHKIISICSCGNIDEYKGEY